MYVIRTRIKTRKYKCKGQWLWTYKKNQSMYILIRTQNNRICSSVQGNKEALFIGKYLTIHLYLSFVTARTKDH